MKRAFLAGGWGQFKQGVQEETVHVWSSMRSHVFDIDPGKTWAWPAGEWGTEEQFAPISLTELSGTLEAFAEATSVVRDLSSVLRRLVEDLGLVRQELADVREDLRERTRCRSAMVHELGTAGLRLREPIHVMIEQFDDEVIARIPEIETFASAETEADALEALKQDIVALYTDLAGSPIEKLGELPRRWLRVLTQMIAD